MAGVLKYPAGRFVRGHLHQDGGRTIGAAIVNQHEFERAASGDQYRKHFAKHIGDIVRFVVERDDNGNF